VFRFNDLISNFLDDALGFGERDEPRGRSERRKYSAVHQRDGDDADGIKRRKGQGGRHNRRKERFDFFDG
tara:strand:+ start:267252 stop:267461 length:210 start_codon:yes stop_codon:yes gene_type:complete